MVCFENVLKLFDGRDKGAIYNITSNKRSVLRRQSRDTNRNIKRSVYCQYK